MRMIRVFYVAHFINPKGVKDCLKSLVAPRSSFYLPFLVNHRESKQVSTILGMALCEREENQSIMASNQHTTKQKAGAWHVRVFVSMMVKGKHSSGQNAYIQGMCVCSDIANVQKKTFIIQKACIAAKQVCSHALCGK